jgi:hypothetical protein
MRPSSGSSRSRTAKSQQHRSGSVARGPHTSGAGARTSAAGRARACRRRAQLTRAPCLTLAGAHVIAPQLVADLGAGRAIRTRTADHSPHLARNRRCAQLGRVAVDNQRACASQQDDGDRHNAQTVWPEWHAQRRARINDRTLASPMIRSHAHQARHPVIAGRARKQPLSSQIQLRAVPRRHNANPLQRD